MTYGKGYRVRGINLPPNTRVVEVYKSREIREGIVRGREVFFVQVGPHRDWQARRTLLAAKQIISCDLGKTGTAGMLAEC